MQLPTAIGGALQTWQVGDCYNLVIQAQQRQTVTDKRRYAPFIKQTLQVTMPAPWQHDLLTRPTVTQLPVTYGQAALNMHDAITSQR